MHIIVFLFHYQGCKLIMGEKNFFFFIGKIPGGKKQLLRWQLHEMTIISSRWQQRITHQGCISQKHRKLKDIVDPLKQWSDDQLRLTMHLGNIAQLGCHFHSLVSTSGFWIYSKSINLSSIVVWDFLPPLVITPLLEQAPDWLTRSSWVHTQPGPLLVGWKVLMIIGVHGWGGGGGQTNWPEKKTLGTVDSLTAFDWITL